MPGGAFDARLDVAVMERLVGAAPRGKEKRPREDAKRQQEKDEASRRGISAVPDTSGASLVSIG